MITFLPATQDYARDDASQTVWKWISDRFQDTEGVAYYKYPVVRATSGAIPEITLLTRTHQPLAIRCLPYTIADLESTTEDAWQIHGKRVDSPILELEDFVIGLQASFDRERLLRKMLTPHAVLALPLVTRAEFQRKFSDLAFANSTIWSNGETAHLKVSLQKSLSDEEWRLARAVMQGIRPLSGPAVKLAGRAKTLGEAIHESEKRVALFDFEQEKVAIPIAPGPQRIRGLAGTGKTVLLAMKAANIHKHYRDKRILFTFNTQSLYNQARDLITKFYRYHMDVDPDWDMLHIRHGWGGRNRPGVYYDLCGFQGVMPLDLNSAKRLNYRSPFQACCQKALSRPIPPTYDFVLVDEAQDFPKEFFQVLYRLSVDPHCVYWTYDELQSLFALEMPKPEDLFGADGNGKPLVSLEGEDYPGGIEKDLVLHKSYRCANQVLMVAHAIGLGLYSERGCVQMLQDQESWQAIGYVVEAGELKKDNPVVIYRPPENSPNQISDLYEGDQKLIDVRVFTSREEELDWIAASIKNDIQIEGVKPEHIVVISLNSFEAKSYMAALQYRLSQQGVQSTIPGLMDDTAAFAETGKVTLSTVFRAKGNEAPMIYILSFESLYDFVEPVERRNMAFTSISRSKMFVRITGVGKQMEEARGEIDRILRDHPRFRFAFPDMEVIRRLDAETSKRRQAVMRAKDAATELSKLDPQAIAALGKADPELLEQLLKRIEEAKRENQ